MADEEFADGVFGEGCERPFPRERFMRDHGLDDTVQVETEWSGLRELKRVRGDQRGHVFDNYASGSTTTLLDGGVEAFSAGKGTTD